MYCCSYFVVLFTRNASGNPKARVPYKSIKDQQVCRFPSGLSFDPPSSFSTSDLKVVLDKANYLFCKFKDMSKNGVCVSVSYTHPNTLPWLFKYSLSFDTQNVYFIKSMIIGYVYYDYIACS